MQVFCQYVVSYFFIEIGKFLRLLEKGLLTKENLDQLDEFKKEMTSQQDFFLENGTQTRCDMMRLNGKKFNIMIQPNGLLATICELPYVGERISMSIILPDRGVKLSEIESKLDSSLVSNLLKTNLNGLFI